MSSANQVEVLYSAESVSGVQPPAIATWETLRFTSEALTGTPQTTNSNEIRSDRMISDTLKVSTNTGGDVNGEFSAKTWDDFLEAATGGTWTADVLDIGSVTRSFTILKSFLDTSPITRIQLLGQRVNVFSLNLAWGEIMTNTITFAGSGVDSGTTDYRDPTDVTNPTTTTDVLNASSDVTSVKIDDADFTGCIQSMTLNINNNMRPQTCIGNDAPKDQVFGSCSIEGTMSFYFSDIQLYQDILNQVAKKFEFTIADAAGNTYTFLLPKTKLTGEAPQASGIDTDVIQEVTFSALRDETTGTSIRITRVQP